jgi:hypothetical protein
VPSFASLTRLLAEIRDGNFGAVRNLKAASRILDSSTISDDEILGLESEITETLAWALREYGLSTKGYDTYVSLYMVGCATNM